MTDEQFLTLVENRLACTPMLLPRVLRAMTRGAERFQETVEKARASQAREAILCHMSMHKIPKNARLPSLLATAHLQFPVGLTKPTQVAPCEVKWWNDFLAVARRDPIDTNWLESTRGPDVLAWWLEFVTPHLGAEPNSVVS